jgi:hypothetical protein
MLYACRAIPGNEGMQHINYGNLCWHRSAPYAIHLTSWRVREGVVVFIVAGEFVRNKAQGGQKAIHVVAIAAS